MLDVAANTMIAKDAFAGAAVVVRAVSSQSSQSQQSSQSGDGGFSGVCIRGM